MGLRARTSTDGLMNDFDLTEFDRLLKGVDAATPPPARGASRPAKPAPPKAGDEVQIIRDRAIRPGGLVKALAGDVGRVVRVGERACVVDIGGALTVVMHEDVRPLM